MPIVGLQKLRGHLLKLGISTEVGPPKDFQNRGLDLGLQGEKWRRLVQFVGGAAQGGHASLNVSWCAVTISFTNTTDGGHHLRIKSARTNSVPCLTSVRDGSNRVPRQLPCTNEENHEPSEGTKFLADATPKRYVLMVMGTDKRIHCVKNTKRFTPQEARKCCVANKNLDHLSGGLRTLRKMKERSARTPETLAGDPGMLASSIQDNA